MLPSAVRPRCDYHLQFQSQRRSQPASGPAPVQLIISTARPNAAAGNNKLRRRADRRLPWFPLTLPLAGIVMMSAARDEGYPNTSRLPAYAYRWCCWDCYLPAGAAAIALTARPPPISRHRRSGNAGESSFPTMQPTVGHCKRRNLQRRSRNATNKAVTWAVTTPNGGTIDANGLYTAPTAAGGLPTRANITATSEADPTKSGWGTEDAEPATIPTQPGNLLQHLRCTASESKAVNIVPVTLTVK